MATQRERIALIVQVASVRRVADWISGFARAWRKCDGEALLAEREVQIAHGEVDRIQRDLEVLGGRRNAQASGSRKRRIVWIAVFWPGSRS